MTVNPLRGEVEVTLGGVTFGLRPSYDALLECERITGRGLVELAMAARERRLSLADMAAITATLIRAWGKAVSDPVAASAKAETVGPMIMAAGVPPALTRLEIVLTLAITGGYQPSGEPTPAAETETTATPAGD